jgi:hypothetical protein
MQLSLQNICCAFPCLAQAVKQSRKIGVCIAPALDVREESVENYLKKVPHGYLKGN